MNGYSIEDSHRIQQRAAQYRQRYPQFANWAKGRGVIEHTDLTQVRVFDLCQELVCAGRYDSLDDALIIFEAADTLTNAAMWLVAHMTYASRVDLSGQPLAADDFKENPQGHTGGSLNMVPAYLGYTAALFIGGAGSAAAQDADDPMAFVRGAQSWADNCARCHNMRDPAEYRDDVWEPTVLHMRIRAGLTGQETRDILTFLQKANDPADNKGENK